MCTGSRLLGFVMLFAAGMFICGCAASGPRRSEATAEKLRQRAGEIAAVRAQVETTMKALNRLAEEPPASLRPGFEAYSLEVGNLKSRSENVRVVANSIREQERDYFSAWEAEAAAITNATLRAESEARRAKLRQDFSKLHELAANATDAMQPLVREVEDLRAYLAADLTEPGVQRAKPTCERANKDASAAIEKLNTLNSELLKVAENTAPPPPPPPASQPVPAANP